MTRVAVALAPVVAGALLGAAALRLDPPRPTAAVDRFVIPLGTASRVQAGQSAEEIFPQRIDTQVGRTVLVENADDSNHVFGPILLAPGQTWTRQFGSPGEVKLLCSIYPVAGFTIRVAPPPARGTLSEHLARGTQLTWLALCGLIAASLLRSMARRTSTGEVNLRPTPRLQEPATHGLPMTRVLLAALPGMATVVAGARLLALSRVTPWSTVWGSPAAVSGWTATVLAALVAFLAWQAIGPQIEESASSPMDAPSRPVLALTALAVLAVGVLALWPELALAASPGALGATGVLVRTIYNGPARPAHKA